MASARIIMFQSSCRLWLAFCIASLFSPLPVFGQGQAPNGKSALSIRFIDSATGYAIQPDLVVTRSHRPELPAQMLDRSHVSSAGRASIDLEQGRHTITAVSPGHKPMFGDFEMTADNPYNIQFLLDPLEEPLEFRPEYIDALRRPDATVIVGFIVDDESGQPLGGVEIRSAPGATSTRSDERGFFQLHLPLQSEALVFEKPGYQTEDRRELELWPNGDGIYRIRLNRGEGKRVVHESQFRRRNSDHRASQTQVTGEPAPSEPLPQGNIPGPYATSPTNSTVRVPRNIRVLLSDNVTVAYVTLTFYTRAVLGSEWIASWGNIAGGTNSLNAGAVAVRCYAIAKINAPSSNYDICATTSCQVYNPANVHPLSDTAVNFTANWVLTTASGSIASTEYSAENNSLGFTCGDGFTSPTGGCIYDPVCAGETRAGHGRGMCQWGSAKWATGRKFTGNSTGNATLNGYPRRDWTWILQHYYPTLSLLKGAPLIIGDDIRALSTVNVRACDGGTISNGVNCPSLTTKSAGATGVIIGGPLQVTNDNGGYTWYQIQWNDVSSTIGWSVENFIERVYSAPAAPGSLTATAVATNQINLNWTNTSGGVAAWFRVERAIAPGGPWIVLSNVVATVTSHSDRNLYPGSKWHYRVRAHNAGMNSAYSPIATATTPLLTGIGNKIITEESLLTFTNTPVASEFRMLLTDWEAFMTETANGVVMFRDPRFSSSTVGFLGATPNLAAITDVFSTNGNSSARALRVHCNFTNAADPWLRLTTAGAATFPNPVIDFTRQLRFNVYADKPIRIAVGCRETSTAAGTAIGSDGGTAGTSIEWAGVTNTTGSAPMPTRLIAASNWTTVTFDFPNEPIRSFSGGNGILSTASGLGVLEHLAIVPDAGVGVYNIYLDNFAVVLPANLNHSLAAGAPTNASIDPVTGVFTWIPTETQGPATNVISVIASNGAAAFSATNTFSVTILESNAAPILAPVSNRIVHAGSIVLFTNSATDQDVPTDTLSFSLGPNPPTGASVDAVTGLFSWLTTDAHIGSSNVISIVVTDNGQPPLMDTETVGITVVPRPTLQPTSVSTGSLSLSWSSIAGTRYLVQFKNDLNDQSWIDVLPEVTADEEMASVTLNIEVPQRFYRILVVP